MELAGLKTFSLESVTHKFPVTELIVSRRKSLRAKVDTAALPAILSVSSRWFSYWHHGAHTHYVACEPKRHQRVFLHRLVTNAPSDLEVDHIHHDGLDNRRSVLRVVTHAENCRNQRRTNKHGFKGVSRRSNGTYRAIAKLNGKFKHLGYFDTAEEAGAAYQAFFESRLRGQ